MVLLESVCSREDALDSTRTILEDLKKDIDALRTVGHQFYLRGWSLGTSGNYSVVVCRKPLELLITASGKDKGCLSRGDFVRVGADGRPTGEGHPKSSAETLLHIAIAQQPDVGAVLHTHSIWGTSLSDFCSTMAASRLKAMKCLRDWLV